MTLSCVQHSLRLYRPLHSKEPYKSIVHSTDVRRGNTLVEWIESEGGKVKDVVVAQGERDGWFLKAATNIPAGVDLITLPKSCQLTYKEQETALIEVIEKVPKEFWAGRLSLKVLFERLCETKSSFWPYLQTLPIGVPGLPIFFSQTAIQELHYPPLIAQIEKRCRWLMNLSEEDRKKICQQAGNDQTPDANLVAWALAIVSSRAFRVHGENRPASMLPLIDLCNHRFYPNCEVQLSKKEDNSVQLKTLQDISEGEALMISYGNLSNDDFLLDYGFMIKENPYDTVQLNFQPRFMESTIDEVFSMERLGESSCFVDSKDQDEALKTWKENLLEALQFVGPHANSCVFVGRGERIIDPRFLAGARVLTSSTLLKDVQVNDLWSTELRLDPSHEKEALQTMAKLMVAALSRFPNASPSEMSGIHSNDSLAISFREEKRMILLDAIRHLASKIRAC